MAKYNACEVALYSVTRNFPHRKAPHCKLSQLFYCKWPISTIFFIFAKI
jgi:hypothetical protein